MRNVSQSTNVDTTLDQYAVEAGRKEDFKYFEKLPKELKDRLNQAWFPFNAQIVYEAWKKYGLRNTLTLIDKTEKQLATQS